MRHRPSARDCTDSEHVPTLILHVKQNFTECKSSHTGIELMHAAVQSAERVPSRLQSAAFLEPLMLHILYNENRVFVSCSSWSTVGASGAVWLID